MNIFRISFSFFIRFSSYHWISIDISPFLNIYTTTPRFSRLFLLLAIEMTFLVIISLIIRFFCWWLRWYSFVSFISFSLFTLVRIDTGHNCFLHHFRVFAAFRITYWIFFFFQYYQAFLLSAVILFFIYFHRILRIDIEYFQ